MARKLAYLVTEDWYFLSHRLPMARAARDAGFEVHVLTRVGEGRKRIEAEGFQLHSLGWQRAQLSPLQLANAVHQVRRLLRAIAPALLHNIALKPALIGGLAVSGLGDVGVINSVNGMGSAYLAEGLAGKVKREALGRTLALLFNRKNSITIVQNPEDWMGLRSVGVPQEKLRVIAGSGVDTERLISLPEPPAPTTAAYVGRMLADKGLRGLVAAHRLLRAQGHAMQLLLAGTPDPDNPSSIPDAELQAWAQEPGLVMLGHVGDIAGLWARAHFAVLPSRREGLPLSLLEASACGRAMVATDVPGCREVVRDGDTGFLVPLDDAAALAGAMAKLASDPELRRRMGAAARLRAETEFSARRVAEQAATLYRDLADGRI